MVNMAREVHHQKTNPKARDRAHWRRARCLNAPPQGDFSMNAIQQRKIRSYIAKNPWKLGHSGKGLLSPIGSLITWRTRGSGHEYGDGHPFHREAAVALGYMAVDVGPVWAH